MPLIILPARTSEETTAPREAPADTHSQAQESHPSTQSRGGHGILLPECIGDFGRWWLSTSHKRLWVSPCLRTKTAEELVEAFLKTPSQKSNFGSDFALWKCRHSVSLWKCGTTFPGLQLSVQKGTCLPKISQNLTGPQKCFGHLRTQVSTVQQAKCFLDTLFPLQMPSTSSDNTGLSCLCLCLVPTVL